MSAVNAPGGANAHRAPREHAPAARLTAAVFGTVAALAACTPSLTRTSVADRAFMAVVAGSLGFAAGDAAEHGAQLLDAALPGRSITNHIEVAALAATVAGVAGRTHHPLIGTTAAVTGAIVTTGAAVDLASQHVDRPGFLPHVGLVPLGIGGGVATAAAGFGIYRYLHGAMGAARLTADAMRNAHPDLAGTLIPRASLDAVAFKYLDRIPHDPSWAKQPIRVTAGMRSAPTIEARTKLALAEFDRQGGFDRSHIIVGVPTGSGWINHVPIEVTERAARGDVSSIVVPYANVPSFMAFGKIGDAEKSLHLLLDGLHEGIARRYPKGGGPKVLLLGESLGTDAGERSFLGGIADFRKQGVDRAIWTGQTANSKWTDAVAPGRTVRTFSIDEVKAIHQNHADVTAVSYSNPDDPVAYFKNSLAYREPSWLHGTRPPGVSKHQHWMPVITWLQTGLIDMKNALAHRQVGHLDALHHDYRAAYPELVRSVYGFDHVSDAELQKIIAQVEQNEKQFDAQFHAGL